MIMRHKTAIFRISAQFYTSWIFQLSQISFLIKTSHFGPNIMVKFGSKMARNEEITCKF